MCPMIAGTISSLKFSEIQAQSMSLGFSKTSCNKARPAEGSTEPLSTWAARRARERLYGFDGQQPLLAAFLYDAFDATGSDELRERVPHGQLLAYAREVFGAAIRRLELHFPNPGEREPLEDPVASDEGGDELGVRVRENVLRRV